MFYRDLKTFQVKQVMSCYVWGSRTPKPWHTQGDFFNEIYSAPGHSFSLLLGEICICWKLLSASSWNCNQCVVYAKHLFLESFIRSRLAKFEVGLEFFVLFCLFVFLVSFTHSFGWSTLVLLAMHVSFPHSHST